jgi:hypothetical protein
MAPEIRSHFVGADSTNLGKSTIPVSRELIHLEASLSVNYSSLDRNRKFSASVRNISAV